MARWRRRALEAFPELRRDLTSRDEYDSSIYAMFAELKRIVIRAYKDGVQATLRRVLEYAEWCVMQRRNSDPGNASAVSFYEQLFDDTDAGMWPDVVTWLTPEVIHEVCQLWAIQHGEHELAEIKRLIVEHHGSTCVAHWFDQHPPPSIPSRPGHPLRACKGAS